MFSFVCILISLISDKSERRISREKLVAPLESISLYFSPGGSVERRADTELEIQAARLFSPVKTRPGLRCQREENPTLLTELLGLCGLWESWTGSATSTAANSVAREKPGLTKKVLSEWKWNSLSPAQFHKAQPAPVCTLWPHLVKYNFHIQAGDWTRYYVFSQTIPVTANPASLTWRETGEQDQVSSCQKVTGCFRF